MKSKAKEKLMKRERRHKRVRAKIIGTAVRPRLAVFRSLRYVTAQLIDDATGKTLVAAESRGLKGNAGERKGKVAAAYLTGKLLAEKALAKGVDAVVFDRGGFAYQGRVAALADGARDGGLKF
ncbi:MAG: 50S ribosomal protein L18 [Candidatus Magasanikbacteria bacterium]|nr:50S ribosomal protein L18 [Candidatus Magasanikbacteria bacterium]